MRRSVFYAIRGVAFGILVVLWNTGAGAAPEAHLDASPRVQFAPGTVRFTLTIESHPDNREYCLVVVESGFDTASCATLDGAGERRTREVTQTGLDAGEYHAYLQVARVGQPRAILSNTVRFEVRGDEPMRVP
jgi:hypothetical protein